MQNRIELEVEGRQVVLFPGATMAFEWSNPIFAEDVVPGSFSLPFDVPAGPNGPIFGFPEVIANTADRRKEYGCTLRVDGEELRGILKLRKATDARYTANIQIGFSAFGEVLKSRSLRSFEYGGERVMGADLKEVLSHMADTAKRPADFDYVFAPVQNPDLYGEKNPTFGGIVNRYAMLDFNATDPTGSGAGWVDAEGNPVQSHFVYNYQFGIFGSQGSTVNSICPFPKLRYVLEQIVSELGVELRQDFFDEELSTLYMLSNAALDRLELKTSFEGTQLNNYYAYSFRIADLLPEITFPKFLQALRETFGLSVQVSLDKVVSIRKISDILLSHSYQDFTGFAAPGHEIPIGDIEPVTLRYRLDDSVSSASVQDITEDFLVKDPVATVANLPVSWFPPYPEHNEIRYVVSLNQYWLYSLTTDPTGWAFYSDNYLPLKISGGGVDVEQGIALTVDRSIVFNTVFGDPAYDETLQLPVYGVTAFSKAFALDHRPQTVRLAFYRGFQPIKEQKENRLYPLLSGVNENARGQKVGEYSLKLDGQAGTYAKFLREWIEFKARPRPVSVPLYMNMVDLKRTDFNKKVDIAGSRFLIRRLKFSLPLTKAVTAELVQVKM